MKASIFNFSFLASCAVMCTLPAMSQPASPTIEDDTGWSYDFGADLRVRQEMMDNIPGNPGGVYSVLPAKRQRHRPL